jgi:hypothetical protein
MRPVSVAGSFGRMNGELRWVVYNGIVETGLIFSPDLVYIFTLPQNIDFLTLVLIFYHFKYLVLDFKRERNNYDNEEIG